MLAHLIEEGGDLFNERKAVTVQSVIIRLSYQMCDDPLSFSCFFFLLGLKRLFKCREGRRHCDHVSLPTGFFSPSFLRSRQIKELIFLFEQVLKVSPSRAARIV